MTCLLGGIHAAPQTPYPKAQIHFDSFVSKPILCKWMSDTHPIDDDSWWHSTLVNLPHNNQNFNRYSYWKRISKFSTSMREAILLWLKAYRPYERHERIVWQVNKHHRHIIILYYEKYGLLHYNGLHRHGLTVTSIAILPILWWSSSPSCLKPPRINTKL
jgi:hypothetical protein